MNKISFICLILILLLSSCSNLFISSEVSEPIGVDLTDAQKDGQETIAINQKQFEGEYGPVLGATTEEEKKKLKTVALILGPGKYRSISYAPLITHMEKSDITVHYVIGAGYGAIVAAMYASGMTGAKIEWCFHRFFNAIRNLTPYTKDWEQAATKYLLSQIKGSDIGEFQKILILPIQDSKTKKIKYVKRGNLRKALLFNLNLFDHKLNILSKNPFQYLSKKRLKKLGIDISIGINLINKINCKNENIQQMELLKEAKKQFEGMKDNFDIFFNLPVETIPLDSPENIPEVLLKTYESSEKLSVLILERLNT